MSGNGDSEKAGIEGRRSVRGAAYTYLERYDPPAIVTTHKRPFVAFRQPAIEPLYESKPGLVDSKNAAEKLSLSE